MNSSEALVTALPDKPVPPVTLIQFRDVLSTKIPAQAESRTRPWRFAACPQIVFATFPLLRKT
jgi:hypothetical protein